MNTEKAFLDYTGKETVTHTQRKQLREWGGMHDGETAASIPMQIDALRLRYMRELGAFASIDTVAKYVSLQSWNLAKKGAWSSDKPPWRLKRKDGIHLNPVVGFLAEELGRPPTEAEVRRYTHRIVKRALPRMLARDRKRGKI